MDAKYGNIATKILTVLLVIAMIFLARESVQFVSTLEEGTRRAFQKNGDEITIVVDAGHGGMDPGKIGINNALEKDINLAVALKLERNLRENGINVVMTRTDDSGLYKETDSNKKVRDMKNRLAIIEEAKPALAVSIHQNSYPDSSVSGVQVFYYKDSVKSKEAAEIIQTQMIRTLKPRKERVAKDNSSYYLLKKTSVPIVIVECAFMSNPTEAQLLTQDDYQEKVAWAIYMGIMQVINNE
ncbi:MAG: N-acetylmuramoyl-L-alanine amidase [Lachnospiraceae bacterium]|nr:N-acetylmuramoyl-L-alanine amidase [Lachnospiraceae bacterium]MDE6918704.1 N-acetylmuramoyl-L-alanine amidase [Lachnospiraceae bacterium]MDE6940296.1 N-acetylmuramoyl-L-alanine amidase [Lachnospiraceae bacterium]MDE6990528.1 N-acetylmuramoyl-L-alanine amidase [Lachnospiraceae bacterium]